MPALIRIALNEMFEQDTRKVLPTFNSIEDFDTLEGAEEELETGPNQDSDTNQSTTQSRPLTPYDFQPQLNLLLESRLVFLDVIGAEGERALAENYKDLSELWGGLDLAIRKAPVVQLLSSDSFRKERSQVRILKTKSRLIKIMEKFATDPQF